MENNMNAVVKADEAPQLPAPVARRGISEAQWRTLKESLFPGAASDSVMMVWDYCKARGLDPLKKPCHIVPMQVKDAKTGDYYWRDVVMPGIYEYRTTAAKTGEYLGHSKPEYGPVTEYLAVLAPEWCSLTVYRWNKSANQKCEFPVTVYFRECAATRRDKQTKAIVLNDRWTKAPIQMLTKCTEAAALREAFPDEFGGEPTAEEMEGHREEIDVPAPTRVDPRGDLTNVNWETRDAHFEAMKAIIDEFGSDEKVVSAKLREHVDTDHGDGDGPLRSNYELFTAVNDKLASDGVITKTLLKKYLQAPTRERA
jgi:phage recombination protein Bet